MISNLRVFMISHCFHGGSALDAVWTYSTSALGSLQVKHAPQEHHDFCSVSSLLAAIARQTYQMLKHTLLFKASV